MSVSGNQKNPGNSGNSDIARRKPEKSKRFTVTVGVVLFFLIAFFLITVVSQLVNRFYSPLKTETAFYYENTDSVLFKGVYIRNESLVISEEFADYENVGVVAYTNKCGSKLAINSVIAVVYSSQEVVYTRQRIAELKEQIAILSDAGRFAATSDSGVQDNAQLEAFAGQLSDTHLRMLRNIADGDYESASGHKNEYLSLQSKINVSKGDGVGVAVLEQRIAALQEEVASLESRFSADTGVLQEFTSSESGYFVSNADGYEDVLRYDEALNITREQVDDIIANPSLEVSSNVAGKVIDDYKWRMAALIETDKTRAVSQGGEVNLRIGSHTQVVPAQVISAVEQDDGFTLFVFECELLNEEFAKKRVASVRLLLDNYSGIRIPRTAVTFSDVKVCGTEKCSLELCSTLCGANVGNSTDSEDGEDNRTCKSAACVELHTSGVYVRSGSVLLFRRINMLRSEEGFVIAENTRDLSFLQLFDDVVVSGINLYDGKIV
ncbi:MAG: hypothetical protein FWH07_06055 [Oscillospiraceae bacterium]|nr:hypothetical protein [Oscillospiraceae bacterium]